MTQQPPETPVNWQSEVFLACASEDFNIAIALTEAATDYARGKEGGTIVVKTWKADIKLSRSILESLQSTMRERDFGVFVYTPVDGKARDNVVFETGMFMGIGGPDNTIILLPEHREVTPSDLEGITGIEYPYDQVKGLNDHGDRTEALRGVSARIVDRIYDVMAQSSANQEQPASGQPSSGAVKDQTPSAAETISDGLRALAALGKLPRLAGDVGPGMIVVHADNGVGRVVGFDPPRTEPRYIEVQFGSDIGRYRMRDLFVAPITL
jgi:hypothetical protein